MDQISEKVSLKSVGQDEKLSIFSLFPEELDQWLKEQSTPRFRADQIKNWLFELRDSSIDNWSNIPKKLKVLAKDKLGLMIQEEGVPHCPLEDAVAALELYKKHRMKWEKVMSYKMERTREITKC